MLNNILKSFTVTIKLSRFYNYYLVNMIAPIIVLSVLDMLPFVIEDTAHEKLLCARAVVSGCRLGHCGQPASQIGRHTASRHISDQCSLYFVRIDPHRWILLLCFSDGRRAQSYC